MKRINTIMLVLLLLLIAIQFIQPARNCNSEVLSSDIEKVYAVPVKASAILKISCYDCHSNNTHYPWYSFIQPGAWWMSSHIKKGKANLNFSEFGNYSILRQQNKLQAIANSIKDETMPLSSYTLLHKKAKLSQDDKTVLLSWIQTTIDSLSKPN
ncbi:MAG: heme-binding domain-containing protein [Ferruginibacter sp.]